MSILKLITIRLLLVTTALIAHDQDKEHADTASLTEEFHEPEKGSETSFHPLINVLYYAVSLCPHFYADITLCLDD